MKKTAPKGRHESTFRIPHSAPRGLRLGLLLFFLALAVPSALLVGQAYRQLKWEAFHQQQRLAEELVGRIDRRLSALVATEEARPFADYAFLTLAGDPRANFLQRSPLAAYPVHSDIPGLIGWFQVDTDGALSTPLLPSAAGSAADLGISREELDRRRALQARIAGILTENRLVQAGPKDKETTPPREESAAVSTTALAKLADAQKRRYKGKMAPAPQVAAQAAFDQLSLAPEPAGRTRRKATLGRVDDLKLDSSFQARQQAMPERALKPSRDTGMARRSARKELGALPELEAPAPPQDEVAEATTTPATGLRIHTFESELDPFELALLDSGQFVLYRKVWRDGQRYIQGALIEQGPFLAGTIETAFGQAGLYGTTDLAVAFRGNLLAAFAGRTARGYLSRAEEMTGALLYRSRLATPLEGLELIFSVTHLPAGPGAPVLGWTAAVLVVVLCGGLYLLYRMGLRQLSLVRQQQDFVSAVSHELKTPLTSIRMFSEMLREGWAPEEKRRGYYDYIYLESERLSRLIANVLQLARMTRNELRITLQTATVGELMADLVPKLAAQCEQAGFRLRPDCGRADAILIRVDPDWLAQILINLVDNAVKFSARADNRDIELSCRPDRRGRPEIRVRDHGPGIARDQMKKIFRLFYRPRSELTRETMGTGIGLALVRQMSRAMGATVEVINREPGAEFILVFPPVKTRKTD